MRYRPLLPRSFNAQTISGRRALRNLAASRRWLMTKISVCEAHLFLLEAQRQVALRHMERRSITSPERAPKSPLNFDTPSFEQALRQSLRQDPDVILVGEMRDLETMATALTAAETGHLVIATLHTNDAVQSIDRIIDVFPPHQQPQVRAQLALCILAVISQRLLPRADGRGRIVAVEIMRGIPAVANLIREGKIHNIYTVMETQAKEGMQTMDAAIKTLYLKGLVTYEEAKQRMRDPKLLDIA